MSVTGSRGKHADGSFVAIDVRKYGPWFHVCRLCFPHHPLFIPTCTHPMTTGSVWMFALPLCPCFPLFPLAFVFSRHTQETSRRQTRRDHTFHDVTWKSNSTGSWLNHVTKWTATVKCQHEPRMSTLLLSTLSLNLKLTFNWDSVQCACFNG